MLAFSKPNKLLIPRGEKGMLHKYADDCRVYNVAIPFFAAEISIGQKKNFMQNIFLKTVISLKKIKQGEGMTESQIIDYIVERTKLNKVVVKAILQKYGKNLDVSTGELNEQRNSQTAYIFYDPFSKQYLEEYLDEVAFLRDSTIASGSLKENLLSSELRFGINMQGKPERALILELDGTGSQGWDMYSTLTVERKAPLNTLEHIRQRITRDPDRSLAALDDLGMRIPVWFVCRLYINRADLSGIHVDSSLSHGYSGYLLNMIQDVAMRNPKSNAELIEALKSLEKDRDQALQSAATFDSIKDVSFRNVIAKYPDLKSYPPKLAESVATFIGGFSSVEAGHPTEQKTREEIQVYFHSAMEKLFQQAVETLYPKKNTQCSNKVSNVVSVLTSRNGLKSYNSFFQQIAKRAGFNDEDACQAFFTKYKVRSKDVAVILEAAEKGSLVRRSKQYQLTELIMALLIEADADPDHKFRSICAQCPNLFEAMAVSKITRDKADHDDNRSIRRIPQEADLWRMKQLLEICIELIAPKCDASEQSKNEHDMTNLAAAQIKADEQLKCYSSLLSIEMVKNKAKNVCTDYFYHSPQYASDCYNLLGGVLDELLKRYDTEDGWAIVNDFFSVQDDAWEKATQLFAKWKCEWDPSVVPPNVRAMLGENKDLETVSLRNKVAMLFVIFDSAQADVLEDITAKVPDIVLIADKIHQKRGHNNVTNFELEQDEITEFHGRFIEACDILSNIVLEGN